MHGHNLGEWTYPAGKLKGFSEGSELFGKRVRDDHFCPFFPAVFAHPRRGTSEFHGKGRSKHMRILMNVIWGIAGGWWAALFNVVFGVLCYLTIVLIPLGVISFKVASLMAAPFGKVVVSKDNQGKAGKAVAIVMNILWVPIGLVDALGILVSSALLAITIVGLPFAMQGFKLARFVLWPFGKEAISKEHHEARKVANEFKDAARAAAKSEA